MEESKKIISEELEALKVRIADRMRAAGQVASGRTIESMHIVMREDGGALLGRPAFGTLEHGRRPCKVPYNFTEIIKQWIIDKGISVKPIPYLRRPSKRWQPKYTPEQRGVNSLTYAIANKIRTEGTTLFREGGRKDIYTPEIEIATANINQRISAIFAAEIKSINDGI